MLRQAQHHGAHHWAAVSSNSANRKSLEVPEDMNRRAKMSTQISSLLLPTLGLFCSKCIREKRMLNIHIFKMVPGSLVCHGDRINQSLHFRASFTSSLCLVWGPLGPCASLHGVTCWLCCLHLSAQASAWGHLQALLPSPLHGGVCAAGSYKAAASQNALLDLLSSCP